MTTAEMDIEEIRRRVGGRDWYHTFELAPGLETPGWFDTRPMPDRIPMPASLEGKRCLDIGTMDGFWAFTMEDRGAAEVLAIDILDPMAWDWPVGATPEAVEALERRKAGGIGFELVGGLLGKEARRVECSVYDLDPAEHGMFDFVYLGSLLLHLRDPVRALEAVRSVCDGELLVFDAVDLWLTLTRPRSPVARFDGRGRPWWWKPNTTGLVRLVESAGFELVRPPVRTWIPPGAGHARPPLSPRTLRHREGREYLVSSRHGDPHAAVLARPVR